jgi:hypothetical protein
MLGDHAKREIGTDDDESASSRRTHSRESGHKHKEDPLPPSSHNGEVIRRRR